MNLRGRRRSKEITKEEKDEIVANFLNTEVGRNTLARSMIAPLVESRTRTEDTCPSCGGDLVSTRWLLGGPYSGHVTCQRCGKRESFMSYVGKKAFQVTPMSTPDMRPRTRYDIAKGKKP